MVRIFHEDGTLHFSHLKKLALSGVQYLHAVNSPFEPSSEMKIGSLVHFLVLGKRPGAKRLEKWEGTRRQGKEWEAFASKNADAEILTATEWEEAERIAEAVVQSPRWERMKGGRFEVPLKWDEGGIPCSTDGVDIIPVGDDLGDLKTAHCTNPEAFKRQCFNMHYAQQLAFYRRGARANGINVRDLFIFGIENRAPYEDVELVLTPALVDFADKSVSLWFEDLRRNILSCPEPKHVKDWPGYTEAKQVLWDVPPWMARSADESQAEAA
jgi:hypothetical protein